MTKNNALFWKTIVTGFGIGYCPWAPGTAGSLAALLIAGVIASFVPSPSLILLALTLIFTLAGIPGVNRLEAQWGKDPQKVVIDEYAGMWTSLLFTGFSWKTMLIAFVLFRFFDISKVAGIRYAEKLPGGTGVMADDLLAGIYSNLAVQLLILFFPSWINS